MSTRIQRYIAAALVLWAFALPVAAHHGTPANVLLTAPGPAARTVTIQGYVDQVVVENRLTGGTAVFSVLVADDGRHYLIGGTDIASVAVGTSITTTAKLDGATVFPESLQSIGANDTRRVLAQTTPASQFTGVLRLGHADNFDGTPSEFFYALDSGDGRQPRVALATALPGLQNGLRADISGRIAANGELVAERIVILAAPAADARADVGALAAAVTTNYLVIPIKFPTSGSGTGTDPWVYGADPFTAAQLNTAVFGATGSSKAYYNEVSYGQQLLSGVVADNGSGGFLPATVAKPATCDISVIASAAVAAAKLRGYQFDASGNPLAPYTGLLYVFNNVSGCGWSGLAYVGWPRAYSNNTTNLLVISHELGHNFGLAHAASLDCGVNVIGGTCTSSEYGDPFDVMGNQRAMHFNSAQKAELNWLPAGSVATHKSGTANYTLTPLENAGGSHYAVTIPAAPNRTYWVEFRQPIGFDSGLSSFPNNGAQIRVKSPFESLCGGCFDDTEFLDMTPATTAFTDGALIAGSNYTDAAHGITISNVVQAGSTLSFTVNAPTRPSFADVPVSHPQYADIETIYWYGITLGCSTSPRLYCPTGTVSRAEMAIFLERAKQGAGFVGTATGAPFADVPAGYWAGGAIEKLYADGISAGCAVSPLRFCPDNKVSRAEMAIFLMRARYGSTFNPGVATGTVFTDVPKAYWASAWVERAYQYGVMPGCSVSPLKFCPDSLVTRAEMATLLKAGFSLVTAPL